FVNWNLDGPNKDEFSVVTNCLGATSAPGSSCIYTVTFTPKSPAGPKSARIVWQLPGALGSLYTQLTGIADAPLAKLSLNPVSLDFGYQQVGTRSFPPRNVMVQSVGDGPLTIFKVTLDGANAADFNILLP